MLERYGDATVSYVYDDNSWYSEGEVEIYPDWVHVVDDGKWIPRGRVQRVESN